MRINDRRKLLTQQDYSRISKIYADDFGRDRYHFDFIDQTIKLFRDRKLYQLPVVDLGSGPGVVTDFLFENGVRNIVAIDIVPEFCKMIKAKHGDGVKVICNDMVEVLNKEDNSSIAAYIANFSINHVPEEEIDQLLSNIKRSLVPGGLFLMSCHKGTFKGMEQESYQTQKDPRLNVKKELLTYMNYFTEDELTNRVEKTGMKIVRLETFEPKIVPGEFPVPKIWLLAQKML